MPIKFDANGRRWVELEFLVPGTPDEVWHAMATGAGNTAWFTAAEIEEKIGGRITFHFTPDVTGHGTVTHWEPPHRFSYVKPTGPRVRRLSSPRSPSLPVRTTHASCA